MFIAILQQVSGAFYSWDWWSPACISVSLNFYPVSFIETPLEKNKYLGCTFYIQANVIKCFLTYARILKVFPNYPSYFRTGHLFFVSFYNLWPAFFLTLSESIVLFPGWKIKLNKILKDMDYYNKCRRLCSFLLHIPRIGLFHWLLLTSEKNSWDSAIAC